MGHTSIVFCISIDLHIRITFFVHIVFQAKKKRKEKAKKQNAFPCKFQKTLKGSLAILLPLHSSIFVA